MAKGPTKSTDVIERLLQERRQYEGWLQRIDAAGDATPAHVRTRVRADYVARLEAVVEELKTHVAAVRPLIAQRKERLGELARKEKLAAERLAETELRHAVGEYDETQWGHVHKEALAELVAVRDEIRAAQADIEKLEELDGLMRARPGLPTGGRPEAPRAQDKKGQLDELAFLRSVTEDDHAGPSEKRASGAQYQPTTPDSALPDPGSNSNAGTDGAGVRTLKCADCGTMNLPTEWYCERCGAELAAL